MNLPNSGSPLSTDLPLVVMHFRWLNCVGSCHASCDYASLLEDGHISNPSFYRYRDVHCDRTDRPTKRVRWKFREERFHFKL